jgi:hypothetical protein
LAILLRLLLVFVDIALHRKGPEDLPVSRFLFALVLPFYITVSLLALRINWSLPRAFSMIVADLMLYLAFFWILLSAAKRRPRYWQTVTAVLGAETLPNFIAVPILAWRSSMPDPDQLSAISTALLALLLLWSIDIAGLVLSRALDQPYIVGVVIMIGYAICSIVLGELLLPTAQL